MMYYFEIVEFRTNEILRGDSSSRPDLFAALPSKDDTVRIKDKEYRVFKTETLISEERWDKLVYVLENLV